MIAVVAAYGYNTVAHIANIAAPWMFFVFVAFGLVGLQQFMAETNTQVRSLDDLWHLAQTAIWKGGDPLPGREKFTFWHVTFFAWFCNTAMHVGMSDLSVFRFARKSWYGIASAAGMYLGHYRGLDLCVDPVRPASCTGRRTTRTCCRVPWPPARAVWRAWCA